MRTGDFVKIGRRVVVECLIGAAALVSAASCSGGGVSSGPLQVAGDNDHQCSPVGPDRTATMGDSVVTNSSDHDARISSITMVSPSSTIQLLGIDVVTLHGHTAVGVAAQYPPDPAALRAEGMLDWPGGLTHHGPWTVPAHADANVVVGIRLVAPATSGEFQALRIRYTIGDKTYVGTTTLSAQFLTHACT
jgi:hypothetical protein